MCSCHDVGPILIHLIHFVYIMILLSGWIFVFFIPENTIIPVPTIYLYLMVLFFTFIFPCAFYNWFYIPFFRNMEYSHSNTELFTKFAAISLHSINLTYIICLIWGWIAGFIYGNTYAIVSDVLFTFIFPCIFYPYMALIVYHFLFFYFVVYVFTSHVVVQLLSNQVTR